MWEKPLDVRWVSWTSDKISPCSARLDVASLLLHLLLLDVRALYLDLH